MATIPSYFEKFLADIRLTQNQRSECKTGHTTLRERLKADAALKDIIVATFLQGSYRRATAIRPSENTTKSDVDVIVVTNLDRTKTTAADALDKFQPFLEKYYKGKYTRQGRSWHVGLSYVELDLVPTSAPSEVMEALLKSYSVTMTESLDESVGWRLSSFWKPGEEQLSKSLQMREAAAEEQWRNEPLWIPDREAANWDRTHPLEQLSVTAIKNQGSGGHFVNVVKCLKWWRVTQEPSPKYPKSYPLEHLLWLSCPTEIQSVAEGVVASLEAVRDNYQAYAAAKVTPNIPDHGVPDHNVLRRVSGDDFAAFHKVVTNAATLARKAYNEDDTRKSAELWGDLFGKKFPEPPVQSGSTEGGTPRAGGYTPRESRSDIGTGRFA